MELLTENLSVVLNTLIPLEIVPKNIGTVRDGEILMAVTILIPGNTVIKILPRSIEVIMPDFISLSFVTDEYDSLNIEKTLRYLLK
jgi:hypothetical protein